MSDLCLACHSILVAPVLVTPCSHSICYTCYEKSQTLVGNQCPKCKRESKGIYPQYTLRNILNEKYKDDREYWAREPNYPSSFRAASLQEQNHPTPFQANHLPEPNCRVSNGANSLQQNPTDKSIVEIIDNRGRGHAVSYYVKWSDGSQNWQPISVLRHYEGLRQQWIKEKNFKRQETYREQRRQRLLEGVKQELPSEKSDDDSSSSSSSSN